MWDPLLSRVCRANLMPTLPLPPSPPLFSSFAPSVLFNTSAASQTKAISSHFPSRSSTTVWGQISNHMLDPAASTLPAVPHKRIDSVFIFAVCCISVASFGAVLCVCVCASAFSLLTNTSVVLLNCWQFSRVVFVRRSFRFQKALR